MLSRIVLAVAILGLSDLALADCKFTSTKDGSPIVISAIETDTPEAREFLATCINPYTKKYASDPDAAKAGRKIMTYNGCTGCHGGNLGGANGTIIGQAGRYWRI